MNLKYLKHFALPYYDGEICWSICPYSGSLLKTSQQAKEPRSKNIPFKIFSALEYCNQPYLCKANNRSRQAEINSNSVLEIKKLYSKISKISNESFYFTRLYASLKYNLLNTTYDAIIYINGLISQIEDNDQHCLQKAFLASKISKSFCSNGVIFIGALLPTGNMHAWIIENGIQPDFEDRSWINYKPLIAFYN